MFSQAPAQATYTHPRQYQANDQNDNRHAMINRPRMRSTVYGAALHGSAQDIFRFDMQSQICSRYLIFLNSKFAGFEIGLYLQRLIAYLFRLTLTSFSFQNTVLPCRLALPTPTSLVRGAWTLATVEDGKGVVLVGPYAIFLAKTFNAAHMWNACLAWSFIPISGACLCSAAVDSRANERHSWMRHLGAGLCPSRGQSVPWSTVHIVLLPDKRLGMDEIRLVGASLT